MNEIDWNVLEAYWTEQYEQEYMNVSTAQLELTMHRQQVIA